MCLIKTNIGKYWRIKNALPTRNLSDLENKASGNYNPVLKLEREFGLSLLSKSVVERCKVIHNHFSAFHHR